MIRAAAGVLLLGALGACVAAAQEPVLVPGAAPSPALERVGPLDGVQALGISADGGTSVAALPSLRDDHRSVLRVSRAGSAARSLELSGRAVALVIVPAGDAALVLVRDLGKKQEIRAAALLRIDLATMKVTTSAPLPVTCAGLALRNGGDAAYAVSRDEVRTFVLSDLRSGPLYRILGDNRGVAPISRSTRALVAQASRVILVDLAAPQGRDGLPVVEAIDLSTAPRDVVSAPDEPAALLIDDNGAVFRVELDPLRVRPIGRAAAIAWPGERAAPAPPPAAPAAEVVASPPPAAPLAASAATAAATPVPPPPAAPALSPAPVPTPPPAAPPEPLPAGSIAGRIEGPNAGEVGAVIVFGPDNVLKEAGRAVPAADGRWRLDGLAPGGYRIVASGIAGRVLICDPPYVVTKVEPGAGSEAPALNVLREAPGAR